MTPTELLRGGREGSALDGGAGGVSITDGMEK